MEIKPIQSFGINKGALQDISFDLVEEAIGLYNKQYGTDYTLDDAPERLQQFILLFVSVTLYGWQGVDTSSYDQEIVDMVLIEEDYQGIDATTQKQLEGKDILPDNYAENRTNEIYEGLAGALFAVTFAEFATKDGKNYVGVITRRDNRVRPTHVSNDGKYWKRGTRPDFSRDYGCRCIYYYGTEAEMIKLGFKKFK